MGLIEALGIDGRILLAQLVNFSVLVWVLWRFAYKPILNMLEERRLKIEKGIDDAEAATERLRDAEAEGKKMLVQARQDASNVMEEAQVQAEKRQQEVVKQAQEEIAILMDKERAKVALEKSAAFEQIKKHVSGLLVTSLQKFFEGGIDEKKDTEIIQKAIKELEK